MSVVHSRPDEEVFDMSLPDLLVDTARLLVELSAEQRGITVEEARLGMSQACCPNCGPYWGEDMCDCCY